MAAANVTPASSQGFVVLKSKINAALRKQDKSRLQSLLVELREVVLKTYTQGEGNHTSYNSLALQEFKNILDTIIQHLRTKTPRKGALLNDLTDIISACLRKSIKQIMYTLKQAQLKMRSGGEIEKQTDQLMTFLTDKILELQENLRQNPTAEVFHPPEDLSVQEKDLIHMWANLDERAVIVEGILHGDLPFLERYLAQRFGPDRASITNIMDTGLAETFIYLREKDFANAKQILQNLGFEPLSKLKQIALYTSSRTIRDFLINELQQLQELTLEEQDMVKDVRFIEKLYPISSFDFIKDGVKRKENLFYIPVEDKISSSTPTNPCVSRYCGDEGWSWETKQGTNMTLFGRLLLEWTRNWSEEKKALIWLEAALQKPELLDDELQLREAITPELVWGYLLRRNNSAFLTKWIDAQFPLVNREVLEQRWPYCLPVTADMLKRLSGAHPVIQEKLRIELVRRGIFSDVEFSSFEILLSRLSQVQSVFDYPHLSAGCPTHEGAPEDLNSTTHPVFSIQAFTDNLKNFCEQHDLPDLLYHMLLRSGKRQAETSSLSRFSRPSQPWLELLTYCQSLSMQHSLDVGVIFKWSQLSTNFLHNTRIFSNDSLLERGHVHLWLTNLMYSADDLSKVQSRCPQQVLTELTNHPSFLSVLNTNKSFKSVKGVKSLYQLLSDNLPFYVSHLFGWQSANQFAADEAPQEMPYFSHPEWMMKYGHREQGHFTSYLKQGRPCFALGNFLSQEEAAGHLSLSQNRISTACLQASALAVQHFDEPEVVRACILFTELLGENAFAVKLQCEIADEILSSQRRHIPIDATLLQRQHSHQDCKSDIVKKLHSCLMKDNSSVGAILDDLRNAASAKTNFSLGIQKQIEIKWELAAMFSYLNDFEMPIDFLSLCAKNGKWIKLLVHAQLYQYSPAKIIQAVKQLRNDTIKKHLLRVIQSLAEIHRASLTQGENEAVPRVSSHPSNDLVQFLLDCNNNKMASAVLADQACRQRNGVLAVLSACLPSQALTNESELNLKGLCIWLYAGLPTEQVMRPVDGDWTTDHLCTLMKASLQHSQYHLLHNGLYIFAYSSTTYQFFKFLHQLTKFAKEEKLVKSLRVFRTLYEQMNSSGIKVDAGIFPISRISELVVMAVTHLLSTQSLQIVVKLLNLLSQANYCDWISRIACDIDFKFLECLTQLTIPHGIRPNYELLLSPDSDSESQEKQRLVDDLQQRDLWDTALKIARLCNLPLDDILFRKFQTNVSMLQRIGVWHSKDVLKEFLDNSNLVFEKEHVSPDNVAEFYWSLAKDFGDHHKQMLLEMAYSWLTSGRPGRRRGRIPSTVPVAKLDPGKRLQILTEIWLTKLWTRQKQGSVSQKPPHQSTKFRLDREQLSHFGKKSVFSAEEQTYLETHEAEPLPDELMDVFHEAVGELLQRGKALEALRVQQLFKIISIDSKIAQACHQLACHQLVPEKLDAELKKLLASSETRQRKTSLQLVALPVLGSSVSIASQMNTLSDDEDDRYLNCIYIFVSKTKYCQQLCQLIACLYKVSKVLDLSYLEVLGASESSIMNNLFKSDAPNKCVLVKAFATSVGIPDNEMAGFLSDFIRSALEQSIDTANSQGQLTIPGSSVEVAVSELLQLCADPAQLGNNLLTTVTSLSNEETEHSRQGLMLQVELTICAHNCFTMACHLEGISELLRLSRKLAPNLEEANQFALLARLLTGVGRYTEMTHVMDILWRNSQFERLLGRGTKDLRLKQAVLDYLEKQHPDDEETFTMVALHFTLYNQIARMLYNKAQRERQRLKGRLFENLDETKKILQRILQDYSVAMENFMKEQYIGQAQQCLTQAKLIALQLQLLSKKTNVLHLDEGSLKDFVLANKTPHQVQIVLSAYKVPHLWADAILNHYLVSGDKNYMSDLQAVVPITPDLIKDVVERYQLKNRSQQCANNMKVFLQHHCRNVKEALILAKSVGLQDSLSREIISHSSNSYLLDIIKH